METPDQPWRIQNGQAAVFSKAPLVDHTRKNVFGKYAYVPVEPTGGPIYYATLGFRSLPKTATACLDFWYQAFVSEDTSLNVYLQNASSAAAVVWSRPGSRVKDSWTHTSVNVVSAGANLHVTISGKLIDS